VPVIVTLTRVGKHSIVDATKDEESMRDPRLCVGVDATGKVRCVHMIHTGPHTTASAW
jgi:exosome complex RNA-binding protein Rrp42 (RNase PH superfamily)